MSSHLFIDNSFLYIEGYKYARKRCAPQSIIPSINYKKLRDFFDEKDDKIVHRTLVGSELAGTLITSAQRNGFYPFTLPKYKDFNGRMRERGVDHKLIWEIAKSVYTRHDRERIKIILCSGDRDFQPIFPDLRTADCDLDVYVWKGAYSSEYIEQVNSFGKIYELNEEWSKFIEIKSK